MFWSVASLKHGGEDRAYLGLSEVLCQDYRDKEYIVKWVTTFVPKSPDVKELVTEKAK